MKRKLILVVSAFLMAYHSLAAEEVAKPATDSKEAAQSAEPATPKLTKEKEKQILIGNLQTMQNQEIRVVVLQQLLGRESNELRRMQAVFCDQYKLDIEKWRKGLYRYDDKEGKLIERPEEPAPGAAPAESAGGKS